MRDTTTAPVTIDDVLARLRAVRRSGSGYVACCPAHDDSSASMSVGTAGGKVLVYCHAGCTFDAVQDALGLPPGSLSGERPREPHGADRKPDGAHYVYTDADGRPLYRASRYYVRKGERWAKAFSQSFPDGNGGWTRGRGDAPGVPYNLPAVNAARAAGQSVYVVEGEKDVATLASLGLVGTCNVGGAGKWLPDLSAYLRGADVVVIPDNDVPGRAHAAAVVASVAPVAESVTLLELPGLAEHGDVTDWVRLGHARAEIEGLVARVRRAASDLGDAPDLSTAPRPLSALPTFSPGAYRALPGVLRDLCSYYDGEERAVALTSALAVISGLLTGVVVEHRDKRYSLHLMHCLTARSGGGKGVLDQVARIASAVDKRRRRQSEEDARDWEDARAEAKRGAVPATPRPFPYGYLLPANASKSYLLRTLEAGGEAACMVETEIDTLVSAADQDWGDFSDLIRKAFHHESYRMGRVGNQTGEAVTIERPCLALALSGTWGQVQRLMGGDALENGLFNRFAHYVVTAPAAYRSSRPTGRTFERERYIDRAALALDDLHERCAHAGYQVPVSLSDSGWDLVDSLFEPVFSEAAESPHADKLLPFVQRCVLIAVRIVGVVTLLRADEYQVDFRSGGLVATDMDVRLSLHIASVLFEHGRALLSHLAGHAEASPLQGLPPAAVAILDALPETFRRADADAAGDAQGVAPRTVKRYLEQYQRSGTVVRSGHTYTKARLDSAVLPLEAPE